MLPVPPRPLSDYDPQNCLNFEGKGHMTERAPVSVLSDDDAVRDSLDALLQANGIPVRTYDSPAALLQDLPTNGCLLIDLHARGSDPVELSNQFRGRGLTLPTIILVHQAPAGDRSNNATILQTPVAADELVAAVQSSLVHRQS
jgi:two-component system, LuxR family, response regulator FixJ